jgi:Tol biopolymer transport system component
MNANGSNLRQLTTDATTQNALGDRPDWSPDGKQVAFDDLQDIYVMNADGTDVTRLTTDPAQDTEPSFSPDGETIIYAHNDFLAGSNIYEMSATGTGQTPLTAPTSNSFNPVWSPDGKEIAFIGWAANIYRLFTMNADGSGVTAIVSDPNQSPDTPSWQRLTTPPAETLTISKAGSGLGTVTSNRSALTVEPRARMTTPREHR